eukprot:26974-Rhodomonas_salina.2
MQGVDMLAGERNYYKEGLDDIYKMVDSELLDGSLIDADHTANRQLLDVHSMFEEKVILTNTSTDDTASFLAVFTAAFQGLHESLDSSVPLTESLPLVSILIEPLVKLLLTFSIITATVHNKSTDVTAVLALFTGIKQLHFAENDYALDHLIRSTVISASAAFICVFRYVPCIQRALLSLT